MGYVAQVPNADFVVADYLAYTEPADLITAWFPFLTPTAILAWRLPLALLQPQRLFRQIHHNLGPNGLFVMVNHGPAEAALAVDLCNAVGLELVWRWMQRDDHAPAWPERRASPPVISCWRQGGP